MGQGHGEKLSLPKNFSKPRGIAKKILIQNFFLSPEAWSKSRSIVEKILSKKFSKSRGIGKKFHSKKILQVQGHIEKNVNPKIFSKSKSTLIFFLHTKFYKLSSNYNEAIYP